MSMINYASREINCKLVYYGPGLGGKTTNLEYVYNKVNPETRGKLISLATEQERTLFFDFLPVDLGSIRGFKTRFHLYTVPGQVYYNASRRLILKGVDGLVFVADSQAERMDANIAALENLYENLADYGYDPSQLPIVLQWNKRDLPSAVPTDELRLHLKRYVVRANEGFVPPPGATVALNGSERERAVTLWGDERQLTSELEAGGAEIREVRPLTLQEAAVAFLGMERV